MTVFRVIVVLLALLWLVALTVGLGIVHVLPRVLLRIMKRNSG